MFSSIFHAESVTWFVFCGLTFVGFGLGLMFWIDFRRRYLRHGKVAGIIVWVVGSLLGVFFGYLATQPEYFKVLTADNDGIRLRYYLLANDVLLPWNEIKDISIKQNPLVVETTHDQSYRSSVVYRGAQSRLLESITQLMPSRVQ